MGAPVRRRVPLAHLLPRFRDLFVRVRLEIEEIEGGRGLGIGGE